MSDYSTQIDDENNNNNNKYNFECRVKLARASARSLAHLLAQSLCRSAARLTHNGNGSSGGGGGGGSC